MAGEELIPREITQPLVDAYKEMRLAGDQVLDLTPAASDKLVSEGTHRLMRAGERLDTAADLVDAYLDEGR